MPLFDKAEQVMDAVRELQEPLLTRREDQEKMRKLIFGQHQVSIPRAYQATALQVKNPRPFKTVKHWTDTTTKDPLTVHREPTPTQRASNTIEKWCEAVFARTQADAKRDLITPFMWSLVSYGEAWLKTYEQKVFWQPYYSYARKRGKELNAELDAGKLTTEQRRAQYEQDTEEYKRRADLLFPLVLEYVPASAISYLRGTHGFTAVAESTKIPYHEALARFATKKDQPWTLKDGKVIPEAMAQGHPERVSIAGGTELTLHQLWVCDDVYYLLEGVADNGNGGTLVRVVPHGYGNPYTRCLYGPYQLAEGILTDDADPRFSSVGILYASQHLHPALDSLLTVRQNAAYLFGYPSMSEETRPGDLQQTPEQVQTGDDEESPEGIWAFEPGRKYRNLRFIDPPRTGVDLNVSIGDLRMMVEEDAPVSVLGGAPGSSGYQDSQAIWQANLGVHPIIQGAQKCLGETASFWLRLVATKIKENVHVYGKLPPEQGQKEQPGWLTVGPKDLKDGNYQVTVTLKSTNPAAQVIEGRTQIEWLQAGITDWESAVERTDQNPDEVRLRRMIAKGMDLLEEKVINEALIGATGQANAEAQQAERQMDQEAAMTGAVRQGLSQQPDVVAPGQGMPIVPPGPNGAPGVAAHIGGGY